MKVYNWHHSVEIPAAAATKQIFSPLAIYIFLIGTNGGIYDVPRVWPCGWALRGMGVDALMAALFNLYNLFG
jgi:hypothetical protein